MCVVDDPFGNVLKVDINNDFFDLWTQNQSPSSENICCVFSVAPCQQRRRSLVPITPMPRYSDMDTPELKNKLNRSVSFIPTLAGWRDWRSLSDYSSCPSVVLSSNTGQTTVFLHAGLAFGLYQSARWSSNWRRSTSTPTSWSALILRMRAALWATQPR